MFPNMTNTDLNTCMRDFPNPYRDELLYSIIARYHVRRGNLQYWQTMEELFDNKRMKSAAFIPNDIGKMSRMGIDVKSLLTEHTQYPFYTLALPKDREETLREKVLQNKNGYHISTVGQIQRIRYLRYCPRCAAEEMELLGEAYWHRLHNTQGVYTCERHHCILAESEISSGRCDKRYQLLIPGEMQNAIETTQPETVIAMQRLTEDIRYAYENAEKIRSVLNEDADRLRETYIWLCHKNGYATEYGSVYVGRLKEGFLSSLSIELLERIGLDFGKEMHLPWIIAMCRRGALPTNPLKHILFSEFLCGSFRDLIEKHLAGSHRERLSRKSYKKTVPDAKKLESYRSRWMEACGDKHGYASDAMKKVPEVYIWLNRHDGEWLKKHSRYKRRGGNKTFGDWKKKDDSYSKIILQTAERIRNGPYKHRQITKTMILREAGIEFLNPEKLLRLPKTQAALDSVIETRGEYYQRKIRSAVTDLTEQGVETSKWKILRQASIPDKYAEECWLLYQRIKEG